MAYRETYERAIRAFPEAEDVILFNEKEQVTESTRANVVILKNGRLVTPPVDFDLLNGCYWQELLENKDIADEIVTHAGWKGTEKIFLINSGSKWQEVSLVEPQEGGTTC